MGKVGVGERGLGVSDRGMLGIWSGMSRKKWIGENGGGWAGELGGSWGGVGGIHHASGCRLAGRGARRRVCVGGGSVGRGGEWGV